MSVDKFVTGSGADISQAVVVTVRSGVWGVVLWYVCGVFVVCECGVCV